MTAGTERTALDADALAPAPVLYAVFLVFLPFSGGYFLSYLFRSTNAVIAPQLVSDIGLSAGDLGLLTAIYFMTFAAFQLPLGLLLDRFGPRRVQACLLLFAALGAGLFSIGEDFATLLAGRALIGLGVAGGLMASFKAITLWFHPDRWPFVNGCFMAIGGLGAIAATAPLEAALNLTDWRGVFAALAGATCLVSAAIFLLVPERGAVSTSGGLRDQIAGLGIVFRDRLFLRLAPVAVTTLSANMAIQGLWAGPWMRDVAGFDRDGVATGLFALSVAMTIGFVATGAAPGIAARRGASIGLVMMTGVAVFLAVQFVITLGLLPQSLIPWLVFGLTANIAVLTFARLSRHFPITHVGRANAALNVLVFGFVFFAQYGMGAVIDLFPPADNGGYTAEAYRASFGLFLALQVLAVVWYALSGKWSRSGPKPAWRDA